MQIPPEEVVISHNGALPNPFMCSDHIPIVADIYGKLIPKPSSQKNGAHSPEESKKPSGRGRINNNKR